MRTETVTRESDVALRLLAWGVPLSLLMDLVDPRGPQSADLYAHE